MIEYIVWQSILFIGGIAIGFGLSQRWSVREIKKMREDLDRWADKHGLKED